MRGYLKDHVGVFEPDDVVILLAAFDKSWGAYALWALRAGRSVRNLLAHACVFQAEPSFNAMTLPLIVDALARCEVRGCFV